MADKKENALLKKAFWTSMAAWGVLIVARALIQSRNWVVTAFRFVGVGLGLFAVGLLILFLREDR